MLRRLRDPRSPELDITKEPPLGACLRIPHEPRCALQGCGCKARGAARSHAYAQASQRRRRALPAQPCGAGWICAWASLVPPHLDLPNIVAPASPKRKSTSAAAMWDTQTGSYRAARLDAAE